MRICHIAATTEGATWMCEQLTELRDRFGHDVTAIVEAGSGELLEKLERAGIRFWQFDFSFPVFRDAYTLLLRVMSLASLFRRERFDVVQTHLFNSMVLGRLAAWLADVPVRLAMIAGPYHLEAHTPRWIDASTMWMETALIPSCEYTRELYRGLGATDDRMFVIYYGPDERKFDSENITPADIRRDMGWKDDAPLIAMVAYFYPALPASSWTPPRLHNRANKRHEDLISAAPAVLREFPDAHFLLIGSSWGEEGAAVEADLKRQVLEGGLQDHVHFLGFRKDVNSLLRAVDVSVQASVSENLGGTLESLLMKCPTVATRSGGMVDSVRDGITGILVEPLNPADLADGILRMLRDPVQARRYALAGQALAIERFSLRRTASDLDGVYRALRRRRSGYRIWASAVRIAAAMPIFFYLATRLARDLCQPLLIDRQAQTVSGWLRVAPRRACMRVGERTLAVIRGIPGAVRRLLTWIRLRPLYAYGWVRMILQDTEVLRRWDILFARIRRRNTV